MDSKIEDRVLGSLFFVVVVSAFAALLTGCGVGAAEDLDDADVEGIDIDAPADASGISQIELRGTIALSELKGETVMGRGRGKGFVAGLRRGEELTIEVGATQSGRFRMYGPQKASGKWGSATLNKKVATRGEAHGYSFWSTFDVEVPADGKFALVFVALRDGVTLFDFRVTKKARTSCDFGGQRLSIGARVPAGDGCNTCYCAEGGYVACTELACAPRTTCDFGGQRMNAGERVPLGDGCNTCSCSEGGRVICTELACIP